MEKTPGTVPESAPAQTTRWIMPREKRIERQGVKAEPYSARYPQVRGGICEFCGVLDPKVSSEQQYKLCPHYRGTQLQCSYCPETKNPDEVIYHSVLNVAEHPDKEGTLIVWCDSYECSRKHIERFKRSS